MGSGARRGFTLVEVAIATLILVTSALVVLMLLPGALRAQQASRFKIIAAAHAQSLLEGFAAHQVDLRQIDNRFESDQKPIGDAAVDAGNRQHLRAEIFKRRLLGPVGQYDLERVVTGRMHGNYPIPLDIARRLESNGDEVRKILDGGGYVYYSDPLAAGRADDKMRRFSDDTNERAEMSRMIWGVTGYAQQNTLPYDPWSQPHVELYPFPPQSRPRNIDRFYTGKVSYAWEKDGPPRVIRKGESWKGGILDQDITEQPYRQVVTSREFLIRDVAEHDRGYPRQRTQEGEVFVSSSTGDEASFYQSNNWEWYAHTDPGSPWEQGIEAYRRLVNLHWLRILDQIHVAPISQDGGGVASGKETVPVKRTYFRMKTGGDGQTLRDKFGQPFWEPYTVAADEQVEVDAEGNAIAEGAKGGGGSGLAGGGSGDTWSVSHRGYPTPAVGLGVSTLRGSDILEEDAPSSNRDLSAQLRISLPSLERRIAYRSAALALWAQVAYGMDITDPDDPNLIYVEPHPAEVRIVPAPSPASGLARLAASQNPLLPDFTPPARLHPAEVLALSYVAHAAVMVTGYRPPFYASHNTLSGFDDTLLVPDADHPQFHVPFDELPYRAVAPTWQYDRQGNSLTTSVWVPKSDGTLVEVAVRPDGSIPLGGIPDLDPQLLTPPDSTTPPGPGKVVDKDGLETPDPVIIDGYSYLRNPYHPELIDNTTTEPLSFDDPIGGAADPQVYQLYPNGQPITYRRTAGGVLSPFPPPYADAYCIGSDGRRQYEVRWQLTVEWTKENQPDPADPAQTVTVTVPDYRLVRRVLPPGGNKTWKDPGSIDPSPGTDSWYAQHAHQHCLNACMTYVSANPYDNRVPKPLNRQTFIDRGIHQFDLFDAAGQAIRPQEITNKSDRFVSHYPITCPVGSGRGDVAASGLQHVNPQFIDSIYDWNGEGKWNGHGLGSFPPRESGQPFLLGGVYTGLPGDRVSDPYRRQRNFMSWTNYAHGYGLGEAPKANHYQAKRPERCSAVRAFEANERCRQIVYWLVDWMQYEDFESAPSAPVDVSRIKRIQTAPFLSCQIIAYSKKYGTLEMSMDSTDHDLVVGERVSLEHPELGDFTAEVAELDGNRWKIREDTPGGLEHMVAHIGSVVFYYLKRGSAQGAAEIEWLDRFLGDNPEANFTWVDPERTSTRVVWDPARTTRYDHPWIVTNKSEPTPGYFASKHPSLPLTDLFVSYLRPDGKPESTQIITAWGRDANPFAALGSFGADRNGNGTFDRGPIPSGTRMQAAEIARFNFYDPVAWLSLGR